MAGTDSITITRTIHPVGQGAFYTEIFNVPENGSSTEHCFVYDCGSTSLNQVAFKNRLLSSIPSGMDIDILFISHFDADHVNGIKILADHRKIKRIVLPQIDDCEWFYIIVDCFENERVQADEGIVSRLRDLCVKKSIPLVQVKPFNDESGVREVDEDGFRFDSLSSNGNGMLPNCSKIVFPSGGRLIWEYVPINTANEQKIKELKKSLEAFLKEQTKSECELSSLSAKQIVKLISESRASIHKIYKNVFGDTNKSSMCLYSGSLTKNDTKTDPYLLTSCLCSFRCHPPIYWRINKDACLYTGDAYLTDRKLWHNIQRILSNRAGRIGLMQIPHHGSINNSAADAFSFFGNPRSVLFVSYGYNNPYGHPSNYLISTLLRNRLPVCQVTDWQDSTIYQEIQLN